MQEAFLEVQAASLQAALEVQAAFQHHQEEEVEDGYPVEEVVEEEDHLHRPFLVGEEVEVEGLLLLPYLEGVVEEAVIRMPADYCTYSVPFDRTVI